MKTESVIMKTETVFSDDWQNRYLLRKEWDNTLPRAAVMMTNPSMADIVTLDYTTLYILNNLRRLGFGSVDIVNMVSHATRKLNVKQNVFPEDTNLKFILDAAQAADKFIIAWGKLGENNQRVRILQDSICEALRPYKDKLYHIADERGNAGFHPLAPQIRFVWVLKRYELPEKTTPIRPDKPEKKRSRKKEVDVRADTTSNVPNDDIQADNASNAGSIPDTDTPPVKDPKEPKDPSDDTKL